MRYYLEIEILGTKEQLIVNEYRAMIVTVYNRLTYLHNRFEWLSQLLEEIGWNKGLWNEDTSSFQIVKDMHRVIVKAQTAGVVSLQWTEIKTEVLDTDASICKVLGSSEVQIGRINPTYHHSGTSF